MSLRVERFKPSVSVSEWIPSNLKIISYETLNFTSTSGTGLVVTGNGTTSVSILKTSGTASWDSQAYISTGFTAPVTVEFNKNSPATGDGTGYAMISWNADPTTNASYNTLDYASYPYQTSSYRIYHNGTFIADYAAWSTSTKLYIVYGTDGYIRHYNGATQLYSVNYGAGSTVYLDSSYYSVNATNGGFTNIRVTKNAWNGSSY